MIHNFVSAGDRKSEYQALEGLSSVVFRQQKYDRTCEYLKKALLAVSADSSVQALAAQLRIVNKLTNVMQIKLDLHEQHTQEQMPVCNCCSALIFLILQSFDAVSLG